MSKPSAKTNAMRRLDRLGIEYEVRAYDVDPNDLSAVTVAEKVGLAPGQVFKTLATRGPGKVVVLAAVPSDRELRLKALALAAGATKLEMLPLKEVQDVTGYVRGAVTALGSKRPFPTYADRSVEAWPIISVSAGARGLQLLLSPKNYLRATAAALADLCAPRKSQ